jgi:hypothetical protein
MAKATESDFESTVEFMNAAESALERGKFSLSYPQDFFEDMDEEDPEYIKIMKIKKRLSKEDGLSIDDVDNRLVMYEYLTEKFAACSCSWRRMLHGGWTMIDNSCNPNETHLAWREDIQFNHVAYEQ